MENVMTRGFTELNENEMIETDGGSLLVCAVVVVGAGLVTMGVCVGNVCVASAEKSAAERQLKETQIRCEKILLGI